MSTNADVFGEFLVRNLRNRAVECVEGLSQAAFKSPGHREYQKKIAPLSEEHKAVLVDVVKYCVDGALNDFLFRLHAEIRDKGGKIQVLVEGVPLVGPQDDPLGAQLWGPEGWLAKFGTTSKA